MVDSAAMTTTVPHCTPSRAIARSTSASSRRGSEATGVYPEVSRQKLAALVGLHKSTITNIFQGRTKPDVALALRMAKEMRVEIEELERVLAEKRVAFRTRGKKQKKRSK